jgi:prepilin peptidase CpaA
MLLFFPAAMALAAVTDLLTLKIPNRLSMAVAAGYFVAAYVARAPFAEIGMHMLCGLAVLAFTYGLFRFGFLGAGDGKLAGATALWMGFHPLADYGFYATVAGGAMSILILVGRRYALPQMLASQPWIVRLHEAKGPIPYGIALALGGMIAYPQSPLFGLLAR